MKGWAAAALLVLTGCIPIYEHRYLAPADPPVSREEAEAILVAGFGGETVQEQVEARGARKLSADDLVALKEAGADDALVAKMIEAERPDPPPPRVVVVRRTPRYYYYPSYSYSYSFGWGWPGWGYRGRCR